ncbi:MAG: M16 family metallopeptidase [Aquabacterium sp.]
MATPGIDAPPLPGRARPIMLPPLHEQRLDGGLSVITATRRALPLVSALWMLRVGTEADPPGQAGLAAMVATLLTKGARRGGAAVDAATLAQQAEALGGTLDAAGGWRSTTLAMTVTTARLPQALALMADCVRAPLLAEDELTRARTQALDGLRVSLASPGELAGMVARRAFWGATPYGGVTTAASLGRIQPADVAAFHRRWYRPENAVLVLAGDIEPAAAAELARAHFGSWPTDRMAVPPLQHPPPQTLADPGLLVQLGASGQSTVMLALPYPPSDTAQRRVAQVANTVLGGGYSARLNQEIRIKRGLSYGAGSDAESHPGGGMVLASAQTDHKNAGAVLTVMREQVASLLAAEVPADELAARQATLIGGFGRRVETTGGLASMVAAQLAQQRPLAELGRFVEEIGAVTAAQVRAFTQAHWAPAGQRAVVVGDLAKAGDGLVAAAGMARRLDAARLDLEQAQLEARP